MEPFLHHYGKLVFQVYCVCRLSLKFRLKIKLKSIRI